MALYTAQNDRWNVRHSGSAVLRPPVFWIAVAFLAMTLTRCLMTGPRAWSLEKRWLTPGTQWFARQTARNASNSRICTKAFRCEGQLYRARMVHVLGHRDRTCELIRIYYRCRWCRNYHRHRRTGTGLSRRFRETIELRWVDGQY